LRTIIREIGTTDEIVQAQRRRQILFPNKAFEEKKKKTKGKKVNSRYNFVRIQ